MTDTPTFHQVDNDNLTFEICCGSKISGRLKKAEEKLQASKYAITRHVKDGVVFSLEVFGQDYHDLQSVRDVVGEEYKLILNTNHLRILIG